MTGSRSPRVIVGALAILAVVLTPAAAQTVFSARSAGLQFVAHGFMDDGVAAAFNPALLSRARVFDAAASFLKLPFDNSSGTLGGVLPLGRFTLGADANFTFPDAIAENQVFVDGVPTSTGLQYGDLSITFGGAFALSRSFSVGAALAFENASILGQGYVGTWLTGGARYEARLFRTLPVRFAADLSKKLLGNFTSTTVGLEPGFRMNLDAVVSLPALRSEVGLELGLVDGDPARIAAVSNTTVFDSLGIGFEALRDFHVTPRASVRFPVFGKTFALSAGLTAGIPIGETRYEFGYGVIFQDLAALQGVAAIQHHFTLSIRGYIDPNARVRRSLLALPDRALRFAELTREPLPSAPLPAGLLDNRVTVSLQRAAVPGDRGEGDDLANYANLSLENRIKSMERLRTDGTADLVLDPTLRIEGETMALTMSAYDTAGNRVWSRGYHGDFARPIDQENLVDRVRYAARGRDLELLPFSESFHQKRNKQTLLDFLARFEKDFAAFIDGEYLKPVTLTANLPGPEVHLGDLRLGPMGAEGMKFRLKPGVYRFTARKKGYPDVAVRRSVQEGQTIALDFPTQTYSVEVAPHLLAEKPGVEITIAGKTRRLVKGAEQPFTEVLSTNRFAVLSGFYQLTSIPLGIRDSRDRDLYLMPDFRETFRRPGFWSSAGEGFDLKPRFGVDGLEIAGVKEGVQPSAKGVQTPPFYARDFSMTLLGSSEEGGLGLLVLVGEGGKKWSLLMTKQKVWVQSDHEASLGTEVKARVLTERDQVYSLVKRDKTMTVNLGDALIYQGPFPEAGNLRIFVGADGLREGERVRLSVTEMGFQHR